MPGHLLPLRWLSHLFQDNIFTLSSFFSNIQQPFPIDHFSKHLEKINTFRPWFHCLNSWLLQLSLSIYFWDFFPFYWIIPMWHIKRYYYPSFLIKGTKISLSARAILQPFLHSLHTLRCFFLHYVFLHLISFHSSSSRFQSVTPLKWLLWRSTFDQRQI